MIPATYTSNPILNILFVISYGICTYFYAISMLEDPGYVPKNGSRAQQKMVMDELFKLWKFDDQNFCVSCMVRMPLRSKHCKRCKSCVAKHDQSVFIPFVEKYADILVIAHGFITALEQIIIDTSFYTFYFWKLGSSSSSLLFFDVRVNSLAVGKPF
jgi:palmitoyltransferase ZDHHC13/17